MKGQSDMDNRPQEQAVKEIDTATINLSAASTGAPVHRRTGKKNTVVAGQIVRLKLALFFLLPLITVSLWTEGSFWLHRWGLRSVLLNLPGAWAPVNLRGLLQFFLLLPVLYAARQFFAQALADLQERAPSPEVLLLLSSFFSVAGGLYTTARLLQGQPYESLPPLFFAYTGLCLTLALVSVYLDRWSKAPLPELRDYPAMILVSGSILLTIVACLSFFYTKNHSFPIWQIAVSIFVCGCPAGLMLAASLASFATVEKASAAKILLRDGSILGDAYKTTLVIFDKTGTLTVGQPALTDIHVFNNGSESGLLSLAAAMLQDSDLPEAKAVREAAEGCQMPRCTERVSAPEGWHTARCFNENIRLGTLDFIRRFALIPAETAPYVERLSDSGKTIWYLAVGRTLYAIFGFSDELRQETQEAMRKLKGMKIETAVMTGDNKRAGLYLGKLAGADRVAAELLPTHKAQLVETFRQGGHKVAVVGDGDNDAPAMDQANIGIAVGSGTKAVWKAAQVVLTDNDLRNVAQIFRLSRACRETASRNLKIAIGCNLVLLPLALGISAIGGGPLLADWMLLGVTVLSLLGLSISTWQLKKSKI